jgi:sodium/hydrogen antiporter
MDELYLALALIAAAVLSTAIFSQAIEKSPLQEPLIATIFGFVVGPQVLGWIDLSRLGEPLRFMEELSRVTLAIALMGVALRLERNEIVRFRFPAGVLITFGMAGMWLAVGLLAIWLLGVPLWVAALIGAVVAPTDPVVATAIVNGPPAHKYLPARVRATLSLESGANDGLAYLIVMLPIVILAESSVQSWAPALLHSVFVGVVLACIIGAAIGYAAARLLHWSRRRHLIEKYSYLTFMVAVSLFTLAIGHLTGAESLLSVFIAGLVFDMFSDTREKHDEENVQEAFSRLATLPMFILFGAALPIEGWLAQGWPLAMFCIAVLLLRRLPVLAALLPLLRLSLTRLDVTFLGWFGPIGAAAIYYSTFATRHTGVEAIWHVASALTLASVIAHGLTAAAASRAYGRFNTIDRPKGSSEN